jgi:hypothetical protein
LINFRVFAGAHIRKFLAKVRKELRRTKGRYPTKAYCPKERRKPQRTAKIFSARKQNPKIKMVVAKYELERVF